MYAFDQFGPHSFDLSICIPRAVYNVENKKTQVDEEKGTIAKIKIKIIIWSAVSVHIFFGIGMV